jgi:hypothetical protein
MNCSSCGQSIDPNKKGFIVCQNCGTVNAPPASAGFQEHHITHLPNHGTTVLHASPPSKQIKNKLILAFVLASVFVFGGAGWAMTHKKTKTPVKTVAPAAVSTNTATPTPPAAQPKPKTQKAASPPPATAPAGQAAAVYNINILVLKYFPLTPSGTDIDVNVTGDVGDSYATIHQRTVDVTNGLKASIEKGTKYLGYKDPSAQSSISPNIIDTKEYTAAVPIKAGHGVPTTPDYTQVLNSNDICNYVNNKGVKEVWVWAYQGPNKANGYPSLAISESKMSGPYGDISNSYRYGDMPRCSHTYVVYTFNYGRGTAEAFHSWGHQIEAELTAVDSGLFKGSFEGPDHPQALGVNGKCGSVHNPPNARFEYDYANSTPQPSNCQDWQADGSGQVANISCQVWGCQYVSDANNPQLNWLAWFWQNMPGKSNPKIYQGKHLRNWWEVHANFDNVMAGNRSLVQ